MVNVAGARNWHRETVALIGPLLARRIISKRLPRYGKCWQALVKHPGVSVRVYVEADKANAQQVKTQMPKEAVLRTGLPQQVNR